MLACRVAASSNNRVHLTANPLRFLAASDPGRSGVLRTPECGAELSLPTADLFRCALIRTPEQIRWSESLSGLQACGLSPPRLRSAPHSVSKPKHVDIKHTYLLNIIYGTL